MSYIKNKSDEATDTVDEAMVFIEKREDELLEHDKTSSDAATQEERSIERNRLYQRSLTQLAIDERFAKEVCRNINTVVASEEYSIENAVLLESHMEKLRETQEILNKSWKDIAHLQDDVDNSEDI